MKKKPSVPSAGPRRAFAYARVSTLEQAERDNSLPAQHHAIGQYAERQGLTIVQTYTEPGASGTDDNRPVFRRMIVEALAPESGIDTILVYQTSRFMRDVTKARAYKEQLRRRGIRVIAIQQDMGDDAMGRMVEGIFENIDQYESEVNGLRTRAAMQQNARHGFFNGSAAPFGFRIEKTIRANDVQKGRLVPDAAEVPVHNEVTDRSAGFLDALSTEYVAGLRQRADWVVDSFGLLDDAELDAMVRERIGKWGAEFAMQSVLWAEEAS